MIILIIFYHSKTVKLSNSFLRSCSCLFILSPNCKARIGPSENSVNSYTIKFIIAYKPKNCPPKTAWNIRDKDEGYLLYTYIQFSSVAQLCPTLCDPMNLSMPGLPIHHQLPEFTQTHGHRVGDAIQPSHPLSSPSPPAPNPSQHQGLFQCINSLHKMAKELEFQHQSFQWTPRTDLL